MAIILYILRLYLNVVYFFIKLFTKQKNKVFFLSRQYDTLSLNYKMIIDMLKEKYPEIEVKVICKKISSDINEELRDENVSSNKFTLLKKILGEFKDVWEYYKSIHVQMVGIATSKVVVVDGYNIPVSLLKHKKNTRIIQLWHALAAIKKFGYQSIGYKDGVNPKIAKILKMHANYDYVISGSEDMIPFFSEAFNTPREKVLPIGTPYVDYLLKPLNKEKIYEKYPMLKEKINILYSPTFRHDGRNNIAEVVENIDTNRYNLIVTYHDKDEKHKKDYEKKVLTCSDIPFTDLIKIADYVITDYSALSVEAAIVKAKVLFYVYDYDKYVEENGVNVNLFDEMPNCTSKNIKDLVTIIENDSYDIEELNKYREKYISNLKGDSTELLCELIKNCMSGNKMIKSIETRKEKIIK